MTLRCRRIVKKITSNLKEKEILHGYIPDMSGYLFYQSLVYTENSMI